MGMRDEGGERDERVERVEGGERRDLGNFIT